MAAIQAAGGFCTRRPLDAGKGGAVAGFMREADEGRHCKSWCSTSAPTSIAGRCRMAGGSIFFTGVAASMRGDDGYTAFASAKFGLRAVARSMAREFGPNNIHVPHLAIGSGVDTKWVRQRRLARAARPSTAC